MRIGVVGCGMAGPVAALLLARDGHAVEILERVADPLPVGAGVLLQPLGQRVLAELGLLDELAGRSTPVRHFFGTTRSGRVVLDFGYDDGPGGRGLHGLGVHRGDLFTILLDAIGRAGIPVRTGTEIVEARPDPDGWRLLTADGGDPLGPYDLVVVADGARSALRGHLGLASRDIGYPHGALWAIVPDPDGLAGDVLTQRYDGTRTLLGFLPTGQRQVSIFWSVRSREIGAALAAGPGPWIETVRPLAGELAPLVERVAATGLLGARYRDVVVPDPTVLAGDRALVLVGDAAHAMSPQLGMGASLAFADAWCLADAIRRHPGDLPAALGAHVRSRRASVRWYTWLSRLMTPVFQSDLVPLGPPRDLLFGPFGRIPWVRRRFVEIQLGRSTSPWTTWPPAADGELLAPPGR